MSGKLGFGATCAVSPPSFALGYTFSLTVNLLLVLCTGPTGASLMAIAGRDVCRLGSRMSRTEPWGRSRQSPRSRTDCVPPGTALSAVPAYEDDDGRWYALRTAVPPRLSHRLRRSELLHSEPRACATACVRLSRADPVGSTGRLPPFFRRLPADNGSLPHNGAYPNTPRGQIAAHGHGTVRSPI